MQDAEDFGESDLDEGFLEFGVVGEFGHVGAVFAEDAELIAPFLVAEVTLVAVVFPAGDIDFKEFVRKGRIGGLLEFFDDGLVGKTIVEHVVHLVAEERLEVIQQLQQTCDERLEVIQQLQQTCEELQQICDERLALIQEIDQAARERLDLINSLVGRYHELLAQIK